MKLLIAVPNTGKVCTELMLRIPKIIQYAMTKGIHPFISCVQSIPHDSSRNIIVQNMILNDCDWLLSIDSDVLPPENITDMINDERPVCAAMVNALLSTDPNIPLQDRIRPVAITWTESPGRIDFDYLPIQKGEILEVPAFGTGCFVVKREVFEKVPAPHFRFEYDSVGKMVLGEDLHFCSKVRANGYKTWMDGNFYCPHLKEVFI